MIARKLPKTTTICLKDWGTNLNRLTPGKEGTISALKKENRMD